MEEEEDAKEYKVVGQPDKCGEVTQGEMESVFYGRVVLNRNGT